MKRLKPLPISGRIKGKRGESKQDKDDSKVYQTQRWRRFRLMYLSEFPLCVHCESKGFAVEAKELDHIIQIKKGGEMYSYNNLQGLCKSCHARKSAGEKGE